MILKKNFFKLMNNAVFGKTMDDVKNIEILNKKKLLGVTTKFSYYKVFHRIYISNRNEKNADTYE